MGRITSLGYLIKAAKELPWISLGAEQAADCFPSADTLLATPMEWCIRWVNHPPGPRSPPLAFRMGEVFSFNADTRLLDWRKDLETHQGILGSTEPLQIHA
ncbi:hypothetical protein EMPS_00122 [Entomortierella parvispora]|uniref:Uncharacterized protein n=1 Tax=Entomortierella parvispora TaxID=205924 RepID=A0A9P3GZE1_9FUNG|nr:hypothetical protein EMPS_00122 [Entomortierella parvispora]